VVQPTFSAGSKPKLVFGRFARLAIFGNYITNKGEACLGIWEIVYPETAFFEAPKYVTLGAAKNTSADAIDDAANQVDNKFNGRMRPSDATMREQVKNLFFGQIRTEMERFGGRLSWNNNYNTISLFLYRGSLVRTNCE
jgi:hypothetical protein